MYKYLGFSIVLSLIARVLGLSSYHVIDGLGTTLTLLNLAIVQINIVLFLLVITMIIDDFMQVKEMVYSRGISKKQLHKIVYQKVILAISIFISVSLIFNVILFTFEPFYTFNYWLNFVVIGFIMVKLCSYIELEQLLLTIIIFTIVDGSRNFLIIFNNMHFLMLVMKMFSASLIGIYYFLLGGNDD